jgi:hypothetical protein
MANLGSTETQLSEAFQRVRQRWEATKEIWNDTVSQDFEQNYWSSLEHQTQATLAEMSRLAEIISQAHRSVSDD